MPNEIKEKSKKNWSESSRKYYQENIEKVRESKRRYYAAHREELLKQSREKSAQKKIEMSKQPMPPQKYAFKNCSMCGMSLPNNDVYFAWHNRALNKLACKCKICAQETRRLKADNMFEFDRAEKLARTTGRIKRKKTGRGTTVVRFMDDWKPNTQFKPLASFWGFRSATETGL